MILMKAYPSNASIIKKTIKFPSGKEICLGNQGMKSYIVTLKEELDFLSKQRDIQLVKPSEKELVQYLESLPEVPVAGAKVENPKAFDPSQMEEELLREELIKRGWNVNKSSGSQESSSSLSKISDTAFVTEFARRYKINPDIAKATGIELSTNENTDLATMSFEELKQLMAKLGYGGLRKKG
jgi:hypothetical protein